MSGGRFDYKQHWLNEIADAIELIIDKNGFESREDWSADGYPKPMIDCDIFEDADELQRIEIISEVKALHESLRNCYHRVHCIDYYLSGDLGATSYLSKLNSLSP